MTVFFPKESITDEELLAHLKDLQSALLTGAQQVTFQGQTVIRVSTAQLKERIKLVTDELVSRGVIDPPGGKKRTKRVVVSTKSRGFD